MDCRVHQPAFPCRRILVRPRVCEAELRIGPRGDDDQRHCCEKTKENIFKNRPPTLVEVYQWTGFSYSSGYVLLASLCQSLDSLIFLNISLALSFFGSK